MSWAVLRDLRVEGVSGFAPVPLYSLDECLTIRILDEVDSKFILKHMTLVSKRMQEICSDDLLWNHKIDCLPWQVSRGVTDAWKGTLGSAKAVFRLFSQVAWLDGFWMLDEKPRGALMRVTIKPDSIETTVLAPLLDTGDPLQLQAVNSFSIHEPFRFSVRAGGEVRICTDEGDFALANEFFRNTGVTTEEARARVQFYTKGRGRPLFFKLVQRGEKKHSFVSHERSSLHTGIPQTLDLSSLQDIAGPPGRRHQHGQDHGTEDGQCAARGAMGQGVAQVAVSRRPQPHPLTDEALEQARRLQGLWRGNFGPHGTEILCLTIGSLISSRFTELLGLKCSGDPNVPCGELAIRVPLSCESGGAESTRAGRRCSYTCECEFQCDCPPPARGEACVYARQVYDGLTLVAEKGFQSPIWHGGAIVELDDRSGDILIVWKGLFSVRFQRLADGFAEELRRHLHHHKPCFDLDPMQHDADAMECG